MKHSSCDDADSSLHTYLKTQTPFYYKDRAAFHLQM